MGGNAVDNFDQPLGVISPGVSPPALVSQIGSQTPLFGRLDTLYKPARPSLRSTTTTTTTIAPTVRKTWNLSKMEKIKYLADFAQKHLSVKDLLPASSTSTSRQFSVFSLMNFLLVVFNVVLDINNNNNNNNNNNVNMNRRRRLFDDIQTMISQGIE